MIKTRLIKLLDHAKKYIVFNVLWQWISLINQILVVFLIADVIESLFMGESVNAAYIAMRLVLALVVRLLCDRMVVEASYHASVDVKRILREKIYEKVLRLGTGYREYVSTSEIVQMSSEGVDQLETYFGKYLPQFFYSMLAPLTLFVVLSRISMKTSIVLVICVPLIPMSIVFVQKIAKRLLKNYWGQYAKLGDSFLENLQGLTTLKIYSADAKKAEEMDKESEHFRRVTMKVLTMQLNSTSVMDIVAYGGSALGIYVAVRQYLAGAISLSGVLSIILLASEFFLPLRLLGSYFHIAMNGMAASDKIFAILDLEEPEQGTEEIKENSDIHMQDISFSYDEKKEILNNVNIELRQGSFVSLVGESGSGKSTIAGLLTGKNKNYTGNITIGDLALGNVREDSLMKNIVLVRHNSYLFKGTVRDNLQMGNPNANDAEMLDALKQVNLYDFVMSQSGLDTQILAKGANLSGGQCQRLAIARSLLKNAAVYIFDEATSNIDMESEEIIMRVIHSLSKTKTVLLISHRLANVTDSDTIYMLENGSVSESGTHEELTNAKAGYYKLYTAQQNLENYGKEIA